MVMVPAAIPRSHSFGQILNIRQLAALRRIGEVRRQLIELGRRGAIPAGGSRLCRSLQIGRNLLRHLRIF